MEYNVVFDVSQSGFRQWPSAAVGFFFIVIGAVMVVFKRGYLAHIPRFFSLAFLGFALFWTYNVFVGTSRDYAGLVSAFREGRCEVTEGVISDFHPMPYSGHEMEWFMVGGRRFEYSDYIVRAGFNNTASHGGPIHKGLQVRVHHLGNEIAKLEVAR